MKDFPCTKCGACCKNVHLSQETRFLDRGNGMCRYFAEERRECSIYDTRPDICRVDVQYQQRFCHTYDWDTFVALNLKVCELLVEQELERKV